jgi:hypothetical protein
MVVVEEEEDDDEEEEEEVLLDDDLLLDVDELSDALLLDSCAPLDGDCGWCCCLSCNSAMAWFFSTSCALSRSSSARNDRISLLSPVLLLSEPSTTCCCSSRTCAVRRTLRFSS